MLANVKSVFIGLTTREFKNDKGETIEFTRASFAVPDSADTFVLGVPQDVDVSALRPYKSCDIIVDFQYNSQYNNFKGKLHEVLPSGSSYDAGSDIGLM